MPRRPENQDVTGFVVKALLELLDDQTSLKGAKKNAESMQYLSGKDKLIFLSCIENYKRVAAEKELSKMYLTSLVNVFDSCNNI